MGSILSATTVFLCCPLTASTNHQRQTRKASGFLSTHKSAGACNAHNGHPRPAFAVGRLKGVIAATVTALWQGRANIQVVIDTVLRQHKQHLNRSQVTPFFSKLSKTELQRTGRPLSDRLAAEGVVDFLAYLRSLESVQYRLLPLNVTTNAMNMCDENGNLTPTSFSISEDTAGPDDVKRIVGINGNAYFVHALAWVHAADVFMFERYPQVLIIDTMHKANLSHNLHNVVSIDGNLLTRRVASRGCCSETMFISPITF